MPIYEYQCTACEHHLEKLQKTTDEPLVECPECHQQTLSKLISAAGFRLKGSGWYETDFKSDKETKRNLADSSTSEKKSSEEKSKPSDNKSNGKQESTTKDSA